VNGGTFTDNTTGASGSGGAIDEAFSGAFLSVNGATFTGNSAGSGGAIFEYGNAEIIHSTFTGNTATQGGAVASDPVNGTSISDSVLRDNSATDGGGIYSYQYIGLSGSEILDNHALQGGGLYENYSQVGVSGTVFRGNSAQDGAGIYLVNGTSASFTDTTVAGNKASAYGGGIDDEPPEGSPPGELSLTDDTVSGNYAGESGGGIYNDSGWITAVGTAIIGNIAAIAGGIGAPGGATTTLTTSPVRGNSPDNCEPVSRDRPHSTGVESTTCTSSVLARVRHAVSGPLGNCSLVAGAMVRAVPAGARGLAGLFPRLRVVSIAG